MPFKMEQNEIDRLPNLPKWAQDMVTRMGRMIDMQETRIDELTMTDDSDTNVSIVKYGADRPLPQNCKVEFKLRESRLRHNDKTYNERNNYTVSIIKDVYTGGELLEIYAEGAMIVEPHATNIIYIRPRNILQTSFVGFETKGSKDVEA